MSSSSANVAVVVANLNDKMTLDIAKDALKVEGLGRKSILTLMEAWNQASSRPILSSVRFLFNW